MTTIELRINTRIHRGSVQAVRSLRSLAILPSALIFAICCTGCGDQDEPTKGNNSSEEASSSSDDMTSSSGSADAKLLPNDEQPGWGDGVYGSCPTKADEKDACGDSAKACLRNEMLPAVRFSVCLPACDDKTPCEAKDGKEAKCSFTQYCYFPCAADEDCPKDMVCANEEGTPMCGWPLLYDE